MITTNVAAECLTKHLKSMDCYFDTAYSTNDLRIDRVSKDSLLSKHGACGSWTRLHANPRSARFMPCKVALGPKGPDKVGNVRITLRTYLDGQSFMEIHEWKHFRDVYVRNGKPLTGSTMFVDVP